MDSLLTILAQIDSNSGTTSAGSSLEDRLHLIDMIIIYVGCGIALAAVIWHAKRCFRYRRLLDPLSKAPKRETHIPFESAPLAILVFFVVLTLGMLATGGGTETATSAPPAATSASVEETQAGPAASSWTTSAVNSLALLSAASVCLLFMHKSCRGGAVRVLLGESPGSAIAAALVMSLVACGLVYATMWATEAVILLFDPGHVFAQHQTIQMLGDDSIPAVGVAVLYLGAFVVAPFAEEVFFRGILQSVLQEYATSKWAAIIFVSAIFAMIHAQQYAWPALFVLSMMLGFTYERTGSLLAPVLMHALFNGKTLLFTALQSNAL